MKTSTKLVVNRLRDDKKYKRLEETFNTVALFNLPREELMKELKSIHDLREIRRLSTRDPDFLDKLINANTHDQAARSRCTAIVMECTHVIARLTTAVEALRQHFLLEHAEHLRQFRTVAERSMVMSVALKKYVKYIDDVSYLKEVAQLVISDIDKGAWSLRNSIEAMKIHSQREVQV